VRLCSELKQRDGQSCLALHDLIQTHVVSCTSEYFDSQSHFLEELPICLLKGFCLPLSVTLQQAMRGGEHVAFSFGFSLERLLGLVNDDTTKYMGRKSDLLAPKHEFSGKF